MKRLIDIYNKYKNYFTIESQPIFSSILWNLDMMKQLSKIKKVAFTPISQSVCGGLDQWELILTLESGGYNPLKIFFDKKRNWEDVFHIANSINKDLFGYTRLESVKIIASSLKNTDFKPSTKKRK